MAKRFKNTKLKDDEGNIISIPIRDADTGKVERVEYVFADMLRLIWSQIPCKTLVDSRNGNLLIKAIEKAKDKPFVEIEEGCHDWLKPLAEAVIPPIFREKGDFIYAYIKEGFEKPHQPQEKKKGKTDEAPAREK